jgi:cytochrome c oxidase assembly protein subunit 11
MSEPEPAKQQEHKRVGVILGVVVVLMFAFGFALVPLYNVICDSFGLNGRFVDLDNGTYDAQQRSAQTLKQGVDKSRSVRVQFLASRNQNLPWEFRPLTREVTVHPGEIREVAYFAKNKTGKKMIGQAVPSVAPGEAVRYFTKIECFCFSQQTFKAGEGRKMPLRFVIDPRLPKDVHTVTLSYTFFDAGDQVNKNKVSLRERSRTEAARQAIDG